MKSKICIIILLLLISSQSYSDNNEDVLIFQENPQLAKADFILSEYPDLNGWFLRGLTVPVDYSLGFKVVVKLSVPQNAINGGTIFRLGGMYYEGSTSKFHSGYVLKFQNNTFLTERLVSLEENVAKTVSYSAWDKNMLKRGCNYTLIFEIDETRLRVTTYEDDNANTSRTEYEFTGLAHSHLKTILSGYDTPGEFNTAAICVDKRIAVRLLSVYTLGNAVVVDNPQTTQPFVSLIYDENLYIRPMGGDTEKGTEQEINTLHNLVWSMWEIAPLFDQKRTPDSYKAKFRNIQSNRYMVVKNASTADLTPIIQWTDDYNDNSIWNIQRSASNTVTLKNESTKKYAVVKDASTSPGAKVVQYSTATTPNAKWKFIASGFHSPISNGYYKIKNKHSNLYLGLTTDLSYVVQVPWNNYGTDNIWYIERQPGGAYTMKNVYMNEYLFMNFLKVKPYPYPYVDVVDPAYGLSGLYLWTFIQLNDGIEIFQAHHNEDLVIENASTLPGAYGRLWPRSNTSPTENALWELVPVDFSLDIDIGGFYKMKYAPTNQYLVVKDASTVAREAVVSYPTGDTKNAWWYFLKTDLGGYYIYNVNSNLLLTNNVTAPFSNGVVTQYYKEEKSNQKAQQWHIYHSDQAGKFLLSNYSGGKGLAFPEPTPQLTQAVTRFQYTTSARWILEPITLPARDTRGINSEPEDGISEIVPLSNSLVNNYQEGDLPEKRGEAEVFCVENELLVKCDCIIKSIDLYDISGKLIGNYKISNYFACINVSKLLSGTYIAVLQTEELGDLKTKFIK